LDKVSLTTSHFPAQQDRPLRAVTVGDALREAAARWGDREALVEASADGSTGRRWTYAQMLADSERLAGALLTRFAPGERIATWAPNTPEWVLLEYGAALAGLTLVTVNPGYQPRELAYVLRQSGAAGLFLVREHRGNPMARIAAEVAGDLPSLRAIIDLEDQAALFCCEGPPPALPQVDPHDPVQIQYTSGTTGFPKGVVLHHFGLTNNARHHFEVAEIGECRTTMCMFPLFHTAGCSLAVLGALQNGGRMILPRQFDPHGALALVEQERVAATTVVPTMLIAMLEAHATRPRDMGSLEVIGSGGALVPPELVREVTSRFGCRFYIVYGQTEASPVLTMTRPDDSFEDTCTTIGQAAPQIELGIFDLVGGGIVPLGEAGEIRAHTYAAMRGYNDDPEATAKAIDADGWLHTGDLGTMDARGYVRITGRVKDMIIRGGENLFPAEIENVLLEHPDVAEVAVVGVPDERMGEAVAAFIRVASGACFEPERLKAHCRCQIAAQKTPTHWIEVNDWPLTGSGKIQKFELRRRWVEARESECGELG
jgi:fatty-acyl-CoA synthase